MKTTNNVLVILVVAAIIEAAILGMIQWTKAQSQPSSTTGGVNGVVTFERTPGEEWGLVFANWTNKPVGVARVVGNRLETLEVKHDRKAPF